MAKKWADRQRRTNALVRAVAAYLLARRRLSADQLYGLCQLTWITSSFDGENASYIRSTKIPGLQNCLSTDFTGKSLATIASEVAEIIDSPIAARLTESHTGFTHFYKPYRRSSQKWLGQHWQDVEAIVRRGFDLTSDQDAVSVAEAIDRLPGIPKANTRGQLMRAANLLTPLLFALDKRIRFPIVNGRSIKGLLARMKAGKQPLPKQLECLIAMIGKRGIRDAADLDQLASDLPRFKENSWEVLKPRKTVGKPLPIKDERDIEILQKAKSVKYRHLHNTLTNLLIKNFPSVGLYEGDDRNARYDALVADFDGKGNDLMIEVKSSTDPAYIRIAVGQLLDYWRRAKGDAPKHLAVLTPEKPSEDTIAFLDWLGIGVLWVDRDRFATCTKWLVQLCGKQSE